MHALKSAAIGMPTATPTVTFLFDLEDCSEKAGVKNDVDDEVVELDDKFIVSDDEVIKTAEMIRIAEISKAEVIEVAEISKSVD